KAGAQVASADDFAREAVAPGTAGLERVVEIFGREVLLPDGTLDRRALGHMVFADAEARRRLEAVVHPEVRALAQEWTARQRDAGEELAVWEIPLLFETGMKSEVDVVVVVQAPEALRRRRMAETREMDEKEAQAVIDAQLLDEERRERADILIENSGTRAELARRALGVLDELRAGAS
ncbi:MAG: dephospho-CoA kinase, partial [Gemmatimonadetes bacterium]|nr:dephospho-CoA kinase [Gemmatimonadota bacterium]